MENIISLLHQNGLTDTDYLLVESQNSFRITFHEEKAHDVTAKIVAALVDELGFHYIYQEKKNLLIFK